MCDNPQQFHIGQAFMRVKQWEGSDDDLISLNEDDTTFGVREGVGPTKHFETWQFNTALHTAGEGDFRLTLMRQDGVGWTIVDYEAL